MINGFFRDNSVIGVVSFDNDRVVDLNFVHIGYWDHLKIRFELTRGELVRC